VGNFKKVDRCRLAFFSETFKGGDGCMSDHATNETKTCSLIKGMILEDLKRSDSIFAGLSEPE